MNRETKKARILGALEVLSAVLYLGTILGGAALASLAILGSVLSGGY